MKYRLFFTGLCSTPFTVGLLCETTNEVIHEINVDCPKSSDSRKRYDKMMGILKVKYSTLID